MLYDLVIENGRVIDPESNRDEVLSMGITDGRIQAMTLQKLAKQVPEPYNKQLTDIRAKISDAVAKLSSRNDLNRQLTDNGMKYIDFSLQLISSSGPETPVYGSSGQEVLNGPKRNMLDIKY